MIPDRVALTGFMGSGKSTVGRALALHLCRPFIDLDREIEARAGRRIPEIFRAEGEGGFRAQETRALAAVAVVPGPWVLALGGGTLTEGPSRGALAGATLVHLHARPETLAGRLAASAAADRPLLAHGFPHDLYVQRQPLYARADLVVVTDDRTPDEVAAAVLAELEGG